MNRQQTVRLWSGLLICAGLLQSHAAADEKQRVTETHDRIYVSPEGQDHWSGTLPEPNTTKTDGPLASLVAARDTIRQWKAQQRFRRPIDVLALSGTYRIREPITLTTEDGGTAEKPITYKAIPSDRPTISGGKPISGWTVHHEEILQVALPHDSGLPETVWQLFFQGRSQPRAGWPNRDQQNRLHSGWAFVKELLSPRPGEPVRFSFTSDRVPQAWSKPESAEVNVFPWYCWINDSIPLHHIDTNGQTIALSRDPSPSWMPFVAGNRFRVENVLEELDQPGEWCFDSTTRVLYFWPPEPLSKSASVELPICDTLIELRGTPDAPVEYLTIAGFAFTETRTTFPQQLSPNFHSPLLRGGAIVLEHCRHCRIVDNEFLELGADAIRLEGCNDRHEIVGNRIAHVGGAGISLSSRDEAGNVVTWADEAALQAVSTRLPKLRRNLIKNNLIHHCGEIKKSGAAIHLYGINSVDTVIRHNEIHHTPDKAMNMQDGFGRFIVEYNELHDLGLEIADTGGIATNRWFPLKADPELAEGNVIRFNRICDVVGCAAYSEQRAPQGEGDRLSSDGRIRSPFYTWGIYFDNSGDEITVFGNIVVHAVLGGVTMSVGQPRNITVENNIFFDCSGNQLDLRMEPGARGNRFVRNILCYRNPEAMLFAAHDRAKSTIAECDQNLYWHTGGQPLRVRGLTGGTLDDWKKLGFDARSQVADPQFVDLANDDLRLRPESPAVAMGFRPIEIEQIGLREPYRSRFKNTPD